MSILPRIILCSPPQTKKKKTKQNKKKKNKKKKNEIDYPHQESEI